MLELFGIPCPTCGYTTTFSLFVRGQWLASAWNQPAGFAVAIVCAVVAWAALYLACSGRQGVLLLAGKLVTPRLIVMAGVFLLLGWAWKIALMKVGVPALW